MTGQFPVLFDSGGVPLAGLLHAPEAGLAPGTPLVIVTGSWLTVKEQMPAVYARRLATAGYAALTFDFAGFGASGGSPRQVEMPTRKIGDIRGAADFVLRQWGLSRPLGLLSICASAQYALAALAAGAPIRAFASVAGWYHDAETVKAFYGGDQGVASRLARAAAAAQALAAGESPRLVPAYADGDDRAGMFFPVDYYARPERGAVATWRNEMDEMSWLHWLTFDGLGAAARVSTPTLLVHGDGCVLPAHVRQVHDALQGPRQLAWVEGQQTDFYDDPEHVDRALAHVLPWFADTLRGGPHAG
ncbi:hypothetical protein TBR22_A21270 [Luteitalea sp. TBR-22]|uniref:alpha/beta hydrolase n=1 Tax=Luteitalea sp. TBR-22 TaxID=2802971 RepID=UPI001AF91CC8|nr:hypothetical protein [Luteitalea sp. TBR-22]BCS32903.1 hypothetical protein TBR22_A21270 [Luteitalea sp. TBR-22]